MLTPSIRGHGKSISFLLTLLLWLNFSEGNYCFENFCSSYPLIKYGLGVALDREKRQTVLLTPDRENHTMKGPFAKFKENVSIFLPLKTIEYFSHMLTTMKDA